MQQQALEKMDSMPKKLMVLVRTGETEFEKWERESFVEFKRGGSVKAWELNDPPLSDLGRAQALKLRAAVREIYGILGEKLTTYYQKTQVGVPVCFDMIGSAPDLSSVETLLIAGGGDMPMALCSGDAQPKTQVDKPVTLLPQLRSSIEGPQNIGEPLVELRPRLIQLGIREDVADSVELFPASQQNEWWIPHTKEQLLAFLTQHGNLDDYNVPQQLYGREAFDLVMRTIFPADYSQREYYLKNTAWSKAHEHLPQGEVPIEHLIDARVRARAVVTALCGAPQVSSALLVAHGDILQELSNEIGSVGYGEVLPVIVNCVDGQIEAL